MLISDLVWTPKLISSGASSTRMNIQDLAFLLGLVQLPSQPGILSYVSRAELPASKFTIPGVQMQMLISDLAWTPKLISSGASSSRMNIQDLAFLLGLDLYGNQLMKACAVIFFHSWCRFLAFSLSKTAFAARRKIWMPVETLSKHFTDFSGESEKSAEASKSKIAF